MSSNPPTPVKGSTPTEKRGLGRLMNRMKSVLKGESSSKKSSSISASSPGQEAAAPKPVTTAKATTSAPTALANPAPTQPTPSTAAAPAVATQRPGRNDRARKLAEKYNIDLDGDDWNTGSTGIERVEKPIRMRIHRTCHRCGTSFGSTRTCASCRHARCEECPRFPRRTLSASDKGKNVDVFRNEGNAHSLLGITHVGEDTGEVLKGKYKYMLTKPSKTGGQDLVRKKPMQRVRRNCHCCQTLFKSNSKDCTSCGHVRCADCPRDPAKRQKYPDGYPGDVPAVHSRPASPVSYPYMSPDRVFKKQRRIVRYNCHECQTVFKSHDDMCKGCGHEKCVECPRVPAKKQKSSDQDPEVLAKVQARLEAIGLASHNPRPNEGGGGITAAKVEEVAPA